MLVASLCNRNSLSVTCTMKRGSKIFPLLVSLLLVGKAWGFYNNGDKLVEELEAIEQEMATKKVNGQKTTGVQGYNNQFDKPLSVRCNQRKGEALYKVSSQFSNYNKDRQWKWTCRKSVSVPLTNCKWTSDINEWQGTVRFMCPSNKIMAGLKSRHDNSKEDRKWKVLCCEAKGHHTESCLMTRKLNQYKEAFSYQASKTSSSTSVLVGIESDFKKQYNDRRWQLLECTLEKDHEERSGEIDRSSREKDASKTRKDTNCSCGNHDENSRDELSSNRKRNKHDKSPTSKGCDHDA